MRRVLPAPLLDQRACPPVLSACVLETTATVASLGLTVWEVVTRTELHGGGEEWHVVSYEGLTLVWPSVPPRRAEVLGAVLRQVGVLIFFTWRMLGHDIVVCVLPSCPQMVVLARAIIIPSRTLSKEKLVFIIE